MTTLLRNGLMYDGNGLKKRNIRIDGQKISATDVPDTMCADRVIDADGCLVLPGLIDAHVHFHMLSGSRYTDDDFERGTLGAIRGGVTCVMDFARPIPDKAATHGLKARIREAQGSSYTDFALHMSMQGWYANKHVSFSELSELVDMGVSSLKFFTTYGETRIKDEILEAMLPQMKKLGLLPMVHAENDAICARAKEDLIKKGSVGFNMHGAARPREAEISEVKRLIELTKKYDASMYIAHVSTAQAVELIRRARRDGVEIYCETCPHYLVKTDTVYSSPEAALAIASPPLRGAEDTEALFEALEDDTVQCVSTDHCAFTREAKRTGTNCFDTPAGISGVETALPLLYTYGVASGKLSLGRMMAVTSANPAKIFRIQGKGEIAVGKDADLVLWDTTKRPTIRAEELVSASGYSLYEGMESKGEVRLTMLRGTVLYDGIPGPKIGEYISCR